jgi:hypothetical protein
LDRFHPNERFAEILPCGVTISPIEIWSRNKSEALILNFPTVSTRPGYGVDSPFLYNLK